MIDLHRFIAYGIPAGWALIALWALIAFVVNRDPGAWFWRLLGLMQALLVLQLVVGGILFLAGGTHNSNGPSWLHYAYGALFPAFVLGVAHRFARRTEGIAWIPFGFAAVVVFGLTFRALQTGLGID